MSSYQLTPEDYEWAIGALDGPAEGQGVINAGQGAIRVFERLSLWVPAVLLGAAMLAVAVFVATKAGVFSLATLIAIALIPIVPLLWVLAVLFSSWWENFGHQGPTGKDMQRALMKQLRSSKAPLPLGRVEVENDDYALRVRGGGKAVEVSWSKRPTVHRLGDRVVVASFGGLLGLPDLANLAIVRAEAFPRRDHVRGGDKRVDVALAGLSRPTYEAH